MNAFERLAGVVPHRAREAGGSGQAEPILVAEGEGLGVAGSPGGGMTRRSGACEARVACCPAHRWAPSHRPVLGRRKSSTSRKLGAGRGGAGPHSFAVTVAPGIGRPFSSVTVKERVTGNVSTMSPSKRGFLAGMFRQPTAHISG